MLEKQHYIHLQTIVQASPDIIVLKDAQGRWLETNKRVLGIFGLDENYKYKTEEELGEFYPHYKALVPFFQESDKQTWEKGEQLKFEEVVPVNGEECIFNVVKVPIYDSNGKPDALLVLGRDITEKLKTEKIYKTLFEESSAAIFLLDINGYFKEINKQFEKIWGYSIDECRETNFQQVVVSEDLEKTNDNLSKVKKGTPKTSEVRVIRKDGEIRDVEYKTIPISFLNKIIGIYGIAIDITEKKKAIQEANEMENTLKDTVRQQQGIIFKYTKKGEEFVHTLFDGELAYTIDLTPDLVVGKTLKQILDEEEAARINNFYEKAWSGEIVNYEGTLKNSSLVYFGALRPIYKEGKVVEVIGSVVDITKRIQVEKELKESEERYRIISENSSDMIRILDPSFHITYASPSNEKVLGFTPEFLIGKNILSFIYPDDLESAIEVIKKVLTHATSFSSVARLKTIDNNWKWTESILSPVLQDNEVTSIVVVSRDITERKEFEGQLRYLAYHDMLTGLPNRRLFDEELEDYINQAEMSNQNFAVFYLDLDRFKVVNDTLGHHIGDQLLVEVTKRLKTQIRPHDLLARMGGDEFALLVKNLADLRQIEDLAKKVLSSFDASFNVNGNKIHTSSSIGISLYPTNSKDSQELMKQADIAMYYSKEKGKNMYQFFQITDPDQKYNKLYLETNLRKAILNNELFVMYQPKVQLKTNQIIGCEALVRWKHPELGLISPMEFIHIAEESGFIIPMGEWIVKEVCRNIKEWQTNGLHTVPVAINLSLKQILSRDFVYFVKDILQNYQVEPGYLEFEITESAMMKDLDTTVYVLNELKNIGICIAIDDFGTGYSSLAHLKRFPIDILKIDRSFIKDIPNDEEDMAITSLIISMGKHLNLKIVAEGVETEEQLHYLMELGCDQYQGYYFSPPLAGDVMSALLHEK
ncbi:sensor domain-containing protein [Ureibacillus sinduriensis]|uniref:sensor domain-containing protein n=1 Tax=Ureibacillus sinduriensis TaxID=561440 RepID=UPI00068B3CA7|nr:EAL domain-containing protein [Ureibacillus sinduriensis]